MTAPNAMTDEREEINHNEKMEKVVEESAWMDGMR